MLPTCTECQEGCSVWQHCHCQQCLSGSSRVSHQRRRKQVQTYNTPTIMNKLTSEQLGTKPGFYIVSSFLHYFVEIWLQTKIYRYGNISRRVVKGEYWQVWQVVHSNSLVPANLWCFHQKYWHAGKYFKINQSRSMITVVACGSL